MRVGKLRAGNCEAPKAAFYPETGSRIGPIRKRYVGTQVLFQLSDVASHNAHSKLLISRPGAIASVRSYTAPHLHRRLCFSSVPGSTVLNGWAIS
jgi:hypothetical protein